MEYQYKKAISDFDMKLLNAEIEALCADNELLSARQFTIELILEELITNIIKYGSKAGTDGMIEVRLLIEKDRVILVIADNTDAFNPLDVDAPDISLSAEERKIGGLGIFLVRKKVQSISYEYSDGMNIVKSVI
ncbi:MAG: ATP-binding protein [Thermoclostridium sp.]|nr:ATP-binding protein [Thermoclostridium sp.]